jgi:Fe2+ transport system protein FeoA
MAMKRSALMTLKEWWLRGRHSAAAPWPMTFVGGAIAADHVTLPEEDASRSVASAAVGDRLTIQAVKGDPSTVKQLQRLGLRSGRTITVLSCAESGSVIVAGPQGNVGLGAAIARQVIITPMAVTQSQAELPLPVACSGIVPVS